MKKILDRISEAVEYKRHLYPSLLGTRGIIEKAVLSFKKQPARLKLIELQFTTTCNYRCSFCPYSKVKKPVKFMTLKLLDRIIEQFTGFTGLVMAYATEESLLHPDFVPMIEKVSQKLPCAEIQVSTNGRLLTEEIYNRLMNCHKFIKASRTQQPCYPSFLSVRPNL